MYFANIILLIVKNKNEMQNIIVDTENDVNLYKIEGGHNDDPPSNNKKTFIQDVLQNVSWKVTTMIKTDTI